MVGVVLWCLVPMCFSFFLFSSSFLFSFFWCVRVLLFGLCSRLSLFVAVCLLLPVVICRCPCVLRVGASLLFVVCCLLSDNGVVCCLLMLVVVCSRL